VYLLVSYFWFVAKLINPSCRIKSLLMIQVIAPEVTGKEKLSGNNRQYC
jgi:hypothetical protein